MLRAKIGTTTTVTDVGQNLLRPMVSNILHEGYFTTIPVQDSPVPEFVAEDKKKGLICRKEPTPGGVASRWVCPECFEEFRDELGFRMK